MALRFESSSVTDEAISHVHMEAVCADGLLALAVTLSTAPGGQAGTVMAGL